MSRILNQWHTFVKLKAKIEKREKRKCWKCGESGYLACNCRNKKMKMKRKLISQNKFEIIASRVMQCGVRKKVKMRKQKTIEKEIQYFRCWKVGHYKQECPNIEVEKKRRKKKKQYTCSIWEKIQEYYKEQNIPVEGILLLERGQMIKEIVAIYIDFKETWN